MMMFVRRSRGFTLIELLIVVGIIAILASIAVPNYLEAQTRSKVSRAKADMRSLVTALESYAADNHFYPRWYEISHSFPPPGHSFVPVSWRLHPLTTPVAYITSLPPDPFSPKRDITGVSDPFVYDTYDYLDAKSSADNNKDALGASLYGRAWRLCSAGPDRIQNFGRSEYFGTPPNIHWLSYGFYDSTNGTTSSGDLVRLGPPSPYYSDWYLGMEPN